MEMELTHRNLINEEKSAKIWNVRRVTDALKRPKWLSKQDWCSKEASLIPLSFTQSIAERCNDDSSISLTEYKSRFFTVQRLGSEIPPPIDTHYSTSLILIQIFNFDKTLLLNILKFWIFPDHEFPPIFKVFSFYIFSRLSISPQWFS